FAADFADVVTDGKRGQLRELRELGHDPSVLRTLRRALRLDQRQRRGAPPARLAPVDVDHGELRCLLDGEIPPDRLRPMPPRVRQVPRAGAFLEAHDNRSFAVATDSASTSQPTAFRPSACAASNVVPAPMNGSTTVSPRFVNRSTIVLNASKS